MDVSLSKSDLKVWLSSAIHTQDHATTQYRREPASQVRRDHERHTFWKASRGQSETPDVVTPEPVSRNTRSRSKVTDCDVEQACLDSPGLCVGMSLTPMAIETSPLNHEAPSFCVTPDSGWPASPADCNGHKVVPGFLIWSF